jgi:hypothetical protein
MIIPNLGNSLIFTLYLNLQREIESTITIDLRNNVWELLGRKLIYEAIMIKTLHALSEVKPNDS